jgi:tetratricopeptide (TPR) repeat protein
MSTHSAACPQCKASLRSSKPFPSTQPVRCPRCGNHFVAGKSAVTAIAPAPAIADAPPAIPVTPPEVIPDAPPRDRGPMIALAGVAALLLAGVGGTVWFVRSKPEQPAPAAKEEPKDTRADDERTRKLEEENRKLADRLAAIEDEKKEEKRKHEFAELLKKGKDALDGKHYADALKSYGEALGLYPDDAEAKKGLILAQTGAAVADKSDEERKKQQADYDRLMAEGAKAREDKQYAAAAQAYKAALTVRANDGPAAKALAEVNDLLANDEIQAKKLLAFKFHMDQGNAAMVRQDYALALNNFVAAQGFLPGNPDAIKMMKAAQDRLDAIQDKAKRQAEAQVLIGRGREARGKQQFDQAIEAFQAALKLAPDDRDAQQGLAEATATRRKAKADYTQQMAQGDAAMQAQRFEEALRFYQTALQLFPDDPAAQRGVRLAQQGPTTVLLAGAAYQRFMDLGQLALAQRRFADAAFNFNEALRVVPNDPSALAGLAAVKQATDARAARLIEIDQFFKVASQAMVARQFSTAIKAYKDVLLLDPDNLKAIEGLRTARYQRAMAEGQQAMSLKKYSDAITFFDQALAEIPGDFSATTQRNLAKSLQKK